MSKQAIWLLLVVAHTHFSDFLPNQNNSLVSVSVLKLLDSKDYTMSLSGYKST